MSRESTMARGRAFAESGMAERCSVTSEKTGVLNEATGKRETVSVTVYDGPCAFTAANVQATDVEQSGQFLVSQSATLSLPMATSGAVTKGHVVTITASVTDPALVGKKARIDAPFATSYSTARRFPITILT